MTGGSLKLSQIILAVAVCVLSTTVLATPIVVQVKGMVCAFCAQGIEKKFKALPEIASIRVSLETKKVELDTTLGQTVSDEKIRKIISDAGYDVLSIERSK